MRRACLLAALEKGKKSVFDDHYPSCSDSMSGLYMSAPTEKGESSAAGMEQDKAVANMKQDEMKQEDSTPFVFDVRKIRQEREGGGIME